MIDVDVFVFARLPDRQHLARIVPLVKRGRGIDALVALQPDELTAEHRGQRLGGFGLADAGRAFEQEGFAQGKRQIGRGREAVIGQIERVPERAFQRLRPVDPDNLASHRHRIAPQFAPAAVRRPAP